MANGKHGLKGSGDVDNLTLCKRRSTRQVFIHARGDMYVLHGTPCLHGYPMQSTIGLGEQAHTKSMQRMKRQRSFHESKSKGHTGNVAFISIWPLKVYGLRLGADLPKVAFRYRRIVVFCTKRPMRSKNEALRLSRKSPFATFSGQWP